MQHSNFGFGGEGGLVTSEEKGTLDESDRFMMDPASFASEFSINWSLPSHIVMFDSEERSLREFLVSDSFKDAHSGLFH